MTTTPISASIVIPAHNASATLENCLRGAMGQKGFEGAKEVIVVDDGSADETAALAEDLGVRVIRQQRGGPAAARNAGAQAARYEILAFTDADCAPAEDWLQNLTRPFQDPEIVGAKGTYRTAQRSSTARFVQQEYEFKYGRMARRETIDFIDTYCAAYRREVFLQNGGFETAFPAPSVEDQEFSFRLARKGYKMVFAPQAVVYHRHDENLGEYLRRKFGIGYWKAYMLRWIPEKTLSDSHTPPSQRWQILLLGLAALLVGLALWVPVAGWGAGAALLAFFLSGGPLLAQIGRRDSGILLTAPMMLVLRAAALGAGLAGGLFFPPRAKPRPTRGLRFGQRLAKRTMDLIGGLAGLVCSTPALLLAAIAIKLDSRGPALFVQERAGENGKPFKVIKLRTMVAGAENQVAEVMKDNRLSPPVYKIANDPRVTRVGRFLRRWSIDEAPQFWNVLKGEMSLVGPRPEELWVVAQYDDHQRLRLGVKPGISGPMQVGGRANLELDERVALELDYIQHYSLGKDLALIAKTFPAILFGKGAF